MEIIKETLTTPKRYNCDVCVCGGGVAGIAASLAAARKGAKVILLEKGFMLGGLATAGLVTIYLPLDDGEGHQVCFGLAEELFMLSIEHGEEARYPKAWLDGGTLEERKNGPRFEVQYNAQLFAISAEQLLLKEGVKILYGVTAAGVMVENNKITDIIIEGKSGREAIKVKSVVDTTGDADICKLSGEDYATYPSGNVLAAWYYGYSKPDFNLYMIGFREETERGTDDGSEPKFEGKNFSGIDTEELSEMVQLSHSQTINDILRRRKKHPDLVPMTIPTVPQLRMTRRIEGVTLLGTTETHYTDTVGIFPNWKKRGPVYELPLSCLYGKKIKNLITAGRCISTDDEMWDVARVIPVCAVTGEAAGAAAAMCDDFKNIDIHALQEHLKKQGVMLTKDEVDYE